MQSLLDHQCALSSWARETSADVKIQLLIFLNSSGYMLRLLRVMIWKFESLLVIQKFLCASACLSFVFVFVCFLYTLTHTLCVLGCIENFLKDNSYTYCWKGAVSTIKCVHVHKPNAWNILTVHNLTKHKMFLQLVNIVQLSFSFCIPISVMYWHIWSLVSSTNSTHILHI